MNDEMIKYMVNRFLGWRLPEDFRPDAGVSFKAEFNENTPWPMKHAPSGTNLFDATQAEAMVRYLVEGALSALTPADLAELLAEKCWQPIETAPKDGQEILACSVTAGTETMLVRWIAMSDFLTDPEIGEYIAQGASDQMLDTEDWFCSDFICGGRISPDCYPTHWMPLPTAHVPGEEE